ncbi:MAG: fatty acyl-AMP ligase [Acidobacteria bacterium]|nr:fatty acyl-AMP ligase [Acidobacteriota bacterium]
MLLQQIEDSGIGNDGKTLISALAGHPHIPEYGFRFIGFEREERFYDYAQVRTEALRRAAHLAGQGIIKGDRIALMIAEAHEFVLTFLGAVHAGIIPVPISPPMTAKSGENYLATVARIVSQSGARLLVTTETSLGFAESLGTMISGDARIVTVNGIFEGDPPEFTAPEIGPQDICFLQYTSGSTTAPRGVMVTHANLMNNTSHFFGQNGFGRRKDDLGISWLPLYHDMGLIGFILGPLIHHGPVIILPTTSFARDPRSWLRAIHKYRATITYAPNFAYGHVLKRLRDQDLAELDLSCLRVAGCGAEPIHAGTLRAFAERLAPTGFRASAFVPSYGMAESTLAITNRRQQDPFRTLLIDAGQLKQGRAHPITDDKRQAVEIVSCGRWFPDFEVRIVDDQGNILNDGEVGEIAVKGPSVAAGYFNNPEATASAWRDGWLHTGDRGFIDAGELFVCGRNKELIIIRGANYYPQDIEWQVRDLPGVKRGNVCAFSIEDNDEERLIVLVEADPRECEGLEKTVATAIQEAMGIEVHRVMLLPAGALLRTTSGKLQRNRMKQLYETGQLTPLEPRPGSPVQESID